MKNRLRWKLLIVGILSVLASSCATGSTKARELPPLDVVPQLDVNRYLGKWYEIASIPQRFQKGCVASTATYTLRDDGDIKVFNECRLNSLDGKFKSATGKAWVVNANEPAKLKVRFFWPFSGAYWVIDLAKDYSYSVVGHPSREYLWILSRTPHMDERLYDEILMKLKNKYYDTSLIQKTLQP